ncbi:MAG: hypothetical protein HWD82_04260 [Flavobacteriaceae bacterium]|nr:hypothetical protein [Flavobacteriaceae bacterium]
MMVRKLVLSLFFSILFISCSSDLVVENVEEEDNDEISSCISTNITITELDSIVIDHPTNPVYWKGMHNQNSLQINYTIVLGSAGETE